MGNENWNATSLLEVKLFEPDDFLKIKETLTRIGIASKKERVLYPSCHILHKKGRYYIVHFKELFLLEGRESDLSESDISRRNTIAKLLQQWGLCSIQANPEEIVSDMSNIKIIPYKEKDSWDIRPKFKMLSDRMQSS